jgi:hypothetical protein
VELPLLRRIERYMLLTGMRPTTFGRVAVRDPMLVFDLRRGRVLRPKTEARITAFVDRVERQLEGKSWPPRR